SRSRSKRASSGSSVTASLSRWASTNPLNRTRRFSVWPGARSTLTAISSASSVIALDMASLIRPFTFQVDVSRGLHDQLGEAINRPTSSIVRQLAGHDAHGNAADQPVRDLLVV